MQIGNNLEEQRAKKRDIRMTPSSLDSMNKRSDGIGGNEDVG